MNLEPGIEVSGHFPVIAGEIDLDAIIVQSANGTIIGWNQGAERLLGYTDVEMVGRRPAHMVPPSRIEEHDALVEAVWNGVAIERLDTERFRKGGLLVPLTLCAVPICTADGTVDGMAIIARETRLS